MEKLYSINDTAIRMGGVSPFTVATWLSKGRLLRTKVGRRTMVSESEILRFIDASGTQTVSRAPRRAARETLTAA